ncbi:hypothetical protein [Flavobacterium degerlachei]|jgi:hypothetical protein|uniref:Uncharacterized protein n=1 Tax=Flavobacterium degerlachei TaxID=229203 RepID=A0A1H2VE02_9FLAO|nr:hypothetical protein [Flavobacterium degerlachei]SDW66109.1 hypothetical protein SAMN05444338_10445 [Flavobacterium degerlachei]
MKKILLLLVALISTYGFSQSINNYKYVIIPLKYEFMKSENQYRLATLSKFNLNKAGFEAYYENEHLAVTTEKCDLLSFEVIKEKSFLTTKLHAIFKDCYGKVVYQSETGVSKEKDYQLAYSEALNKAFVSIEGLNYKYAGSVKEIKKTVTPIKEQSNTVVVKEVATVLEKVNPSTVVAPKVSVQSSSALYAQPIANGYQLVDSTPKVVMKVYKTSNESNFIAEKDGTNGVLVLKDKQWFFEYYKDGTLYSEKIEVKF